MPKILVTGGAGYIGSHFVLAALEKNLDIVVIDSLERGFLEALNRIEELTQKSIRFIQGDLRDKDFVSVLFEQEKPETVFHFAAYKSVPEGQQKPDLYRKNNVGGVENLLASMLRHGSKRLVFSSTSSIYGYATDFPFTEATAEQPVNVYAETKLTSETLIRQAVASNPGFEAIIFRYFNAVGAHPSGRIGEDPAISTNLIPVAAKTLTQNGILKIFGNQFNTRDGYQERDYIHVMDLAEAHLKALNLDLSTKAGFDIINLSTGIPTSCLEIVQLLEKVSGQKITFEVASPRPGDPERLFASDSYALARLGWKASRNVEESIRDYWHWIQKNPNGYANS